MQNHNVTYLQRKRAISTLTKSNANPEIIFCTMLNNEGNFWTPSKQISETSPHVVHGRNGLREGDSFCCFRYALAAREKPRANVPAMSKAKGALAAKVLIRRPLGTHDEPPLEFGCCDRPPYPYALCGPFFRHEYASEICLNRASASSLT